MAVGSTTHPWYGRKRNCAQACNSTASRMSLSYSFVATTTTNDKRWRSKPDVMLSWIKQTAVTVTARGMVRKEKWCTGVQFYGTKNGFTSCSYQCYVNKAWSETKRCTDGAILRQLRTSSAITPNGLRPFDGWQTAEAVAFYVPR